MSHLDKILKVQKIMSDLLSLKRLEKLAEKNQFIAIALAEALMHVNYHLLSWDAPTKMVIVSSPIIPIPYTKEFPLTIEGKLAGIGQSFAHSAGKLDMIISTDAVNKLVGMGEIAADIAKAVLGASRVAQKVTTEKKEKKKKKK